MRNTDSDDPRHRFSMMEYPGKELEAMFFAKNYHKWIVDELVPSLGRSVVEVGAGSGVLSQLFMQSGVERLHAFEPSKKLFSELQSNLAAEPRAHLINNVLKPNLFPIGADSVVYVNVLEHIKNDLEELRIVNQCLRVGGSLIIFVPALPILFSDIDAEMGHVRRYTKRQLIDLAVRTGFEVRSVKYLDLFGIFPWLINFKILKNAFSPRSVSLYDRLVIPLMRRVEQILPPPVGKNLLLIARKI